MAKRPRTVLPFPDGIREHWNLPQTAHPVPLAGGYKNVLLRLGEVVVRLEEGEAASLAWEHEALAFLAPAVPEVVAPLPGRDGTTFLRVADGRLASVLPFVAGEPLDRDDAGQRGDLARLLARLHLAGAGWPEDRVRPGVPAFAELNWETNDWWDWRIVRRPAALQKTFERTHAWLRSPPPLVRGIVHGDVYRGNLRVRERNIVGMIDWEHARVDWPAWELANATWEACEVGDELSTARADDFTRAYVQAGGPGELDSFTPLLRLRLLADVLYSLTSEARGEDHDPAYIAHLLRALERLDD